ncbi:MAG: DUF2723 domain-containing protein [Candidatus Erginobacter occultus]|nr:DUF2723 domain-containing protein [Candidatus Erginobacter occultus]
MFLIAFGTYLLTLTPTVDFIDSAEFATVASTLGIAHPTGYPLYTLLGHLFSKLPLATRIIVRLNIMNAFCAAVGAGVFTLFIKVFLEALRTAKDFSAAKKKNRKPEEHQGDARRVGPALSDTRQEKSEWLAALTAGLILAWSRVFWEVGTTLEVYSLHALFIAILLYLAVRYTVEDDEKKERISGFLFFLVLGFSFANHLTTVLLLPAFLLLFGGKWRKRKTRLLAIVFLILPILLGLSLYLYLPLRAMSQPKVMWGEPTTLKALWNHLSVTDFRPRIEIIPVAGETPVRYATRLVGGLTSEMEGDSLAEFTTGLPRRLGYLPIPIILFGIFLLFRQSRRYFYFLLIAFVPTTLYAATYNVPDNIFYYNPSYICLIAGAAVGLHRLFSFFLRRGGPGLLAWLLVPLVTLPALFINYPAVNKKNNYFVEDFVANLFSPLEPNAILFALDVHILIHPLYYYQNVEGVRTDVIVLPNHGLQKGWFGQHLKYHYPEIYKKSAREIEDYQNYLEKINRGEAGDGQLLERKYYRMLSSIISRNYSERPIYITSEFNPKLHPDFHPGFKRVPEGLAWRLYRSDETPVEFPYREFPYRELSYPHKDADAIRHAYMYMLMEKGNYELARGNRDEALKWLEQGLSVYPGEKLLSDTYNGKVVVPNRQKDLLHLHTLFLGEAGRFPEAEAAAERYIRFAPDDPRAYSVLGIILIRQDRREEARAAFLRGLNKLPDDEMLLHNLRKIEAELGSKGKGRSGSN